MRKYFLFALLITLASMANADVTLPYVLSSNMVLQRNLDIKVWGWAAPAEQVTVTFRGKTVKTKADKQGNWLVKLPSGVEGGPFEMQIVGKNQITLANILVGDVWVCSGQSNMEWQLKNATNGVAEGKKADYPNIRLFTVQKNASPLPVNNTAPANWQVCAPETAPDFSAVGYFFGKKIHVETGVPIGLISTNWGGTIVETWTSKQTVDNDPFMSAWLGRMGTFDLEKMVAEQKTIFANYKIELEKVLNPAFSHAYIAPGFDDTSWETMELPALWEDNQAYEGFDGVAWFRKTVVIPDGFDRNKATLKLNKIDDTDIAWVNGERVGETYNQYTLLREYKLPTNVLKSGKNTIVVRIEDYTGGGGIYGLPDDLCLTDGMMTIPLAGTWKANKDALKLPRSPYNAPTSALQPNQFPTLLFNGMIHPLINYAIKGAIWYQGESNADALAQALRYESQLKMMITDWRNHWNVGNFSFYQVQLANFKAETTVPRLENWPYLREAQFNVCGLPNVGMACIIDIGEAGDIHPRNKLDVGSRLALNALKLDYGKDVTFHGPRKAEVRIDGKKAFVSFGNENLVVRNKHGYINGFAVAGANKIFHFAKASLLPDNRVEVMCDKVNEIEAVRFLWSDNPGEINLYNAAGLPAEPFRTDNWNDR
jgi:sialate O-acetylesterase